MWRAGRRGGDEQADDGLDGELLRQLKRTEKIAKVQKLSEEARKLKLANDRIEGRLIDRDEATVEVSEMFGRLRDRLMQMPDQLAVEVPAEQKPAVIAGLRRYMVGLLNELAGMEEGAFS